jgi:hypothetical protein
MISQYTSSTQKVKGKRRAADDCCVGLGARQVQRCHARYVEREREDEIEFTCSPLTSQQTEYTLIPCRKDQRHLPYLKVNSNSSSEHSTLRKIVKFEKCQLEKLYCRVKKLKQRTQLANEPIFQIPDSFRTGKRKKSRNSVVFDRRYRYYFLFVSRNSNGDAPHEIEKLSC